MDRLYSCFNFRLRSDIPLGELHPAEAGNDARPIVEVRVGALPETLPGGRTAPYGLQIADDEVMLTVANTARYLIRGGREVVVDRLEGGSERDMRLFLLGSALGILCHQRGLLPLHANAIVADGAAVAFAGPPGAGKSTLAAHFAHTGFEVLCDDVCVIEFDEGGRPLAWPGLPRVKLWGDAASAFGHDSSTLDQAIEGMDKYHVPLRRATQARPIPFRRLYVLSRAEDRPGEIRRLGGQAAMAEVMGQTYRGLYLAPMGLVERHFRQCAALLASAEVYSASRTWGYDVFQQQAGMLEQHVLRS
jgi:energy-coupling factor transporter ATP-binding protein EcfA2